MVTATPYDNFAEANVHKLKFECSYAAHATISRYDAICAKWSNPSAHTYRYKPRAAKRLRSQLVLITKELARLCGGRSVQVLERIGQKRQTSSSRLDRLKQLDGAFEVRTGKLVGIGNFNR